VLRTGEPPQPLLPETSRRSHPRKLRILIVTNSSVDAKRIADGLRDAAHDCFAVEWVSQLAQGIKRLGARRFDAILANLSLSDSDGGDVFAALSRAAPRTPIMMLCIADDEIVAAQAVERGSYGYFLKEHFGSYLVSQSLRNIIQRHLIEEEVFNEKERAAITLNSISDAVIGTDLSANIVYLNFAAEVMTGWSRTEASGRPIGQIMKIIDGKTRRATRNPVELAIKLNKPMALKTGTMMIRRDGREVAIEDSASPIHDSVGKVMGAVIVFHDITAARALSIKMEHLAHHDFLTNLPNRVLLHDRIDQAISLGKRNNAGVALMFLDLDRFKHINDSLGHAVGDKLLQMVAERLSACVRGSDTVSRQGGDEFVVLLPDYKHAEDACMTAAKIVAALAPPFVIDGHELHVTASIGISTYPADARDADGLIKNADIAMYHAKARDRGSYQFFETAMNIRAVERQFVEMNLRFALQRQELLLLYQPLVNLTTGEITGVEALLRWMHPEWGVTLPSRFVPIAEDSGLIVPMGRWVLREACTQARRWVDAGLAFGSIAVNISAIEFRSKDFVQSVATILEETGLAPHLLQLEITESVLMQEAHSSAGILTKLKDIGVVLAVDDFGTGYSSLSYLIRFPVDVLKIDQSFVQAISSKRPGGVIVSAVIAMGASLNQRVVAEGVEDETQLAFLKQRYCEEGQGYLFSKPVCVGDVSALLAAGTLRRGVDEEG